MSMGKNKLFDDLGFEEIQEAKTIPNNNNKLFDELGFEEIQKPEIQEPMGQTAVPEQSFIRREGPAMAGGMIGATLGTPLGEPGRIAGAAIGGAAGEAYKKIADYAQGKDVSGDTALGNIADIAKSGIAQGSAEATGQLIGKGLSALRPLASETGAAIMKVAAAIPEKYGEAILKKPEILNKAVSKELMSDAYAAFERYTGLKGLEATLVEKNRATAPTSWLEKIVISTANKVAAGEKVDPQELYVASQAASRLKLSARFGEPQAQMAASSAAVKQGKGIVDKALGEIYPEYTVLRNQNFESKAREALSHLMPQNKGGTPSVLRPWAAVGEIARGGLAYTPALPAVSPAAWGMGIRAASAVSPAIKASGEIGLKAGAQEFGNVSLEALKKARKNQQKEPQ